MSEKTWDLPMIPDDTPLQRNVAVRNYELAGRTFSLVLDSGERRTLTVEDRDHVLWALDNDPPVRAEYLCMRADEWVWMLTFNESFSVNVVVVIDTKNDLTTVLWTAGGLHPARPKLATHTFVFGAIEREGRPLPMKRHHFTADLAGKKIAWEYSTTVTITHIYHDANTIRSSLNEMRPLPDWATPEQVREAENRAERWGSIFFEEPCSYVKLGDHLYLMTFIETNRNRVDPNEGGGDLLAIIDTQTVHDVGRTFGVGPDGRANFGLLTAKGRFVDSDDPLNDAPSPYYI